MIKFGEIISTLFENIATVELGTRTCFGLFGEVELPECLREDAKEEN